MKLRRRDFLAAGATLGAVRFVRAQVGTSFPLMFSVESFAVSESIGMALYASAPCTVETTLTDADNRPLSAPFKLTTNADKRSAAALNPSPAAFKGPLVVEMKVVPTTPRRPFVSVVLESPGKSSMSELEKAAEQALFVKNPTRRPEGGHFLINLKADSDVTLTIKQSRPSGPPILRRVDRNLSAGDTPIRWDLRDRAGTIVGPDEYLATLEATPKMPNRSATLYTSSLRVL